MPKIVHLSSVHPVSDNRIRHKECAALARAGYDVVLIAPGSDKVEDENIHLRLVPKPKSRWTRILRTTWLVYKAAKEEDAAVYHFHDPELLIVGLLLSRTGAAVVYDVHEDVPATLAYKYYLPKWIRPAIHWIIDRAERALARRMSATVVATPSIEGRFRGVARRVVRVQNFPREREYERADRRPIDSRPMWVSYIGVSSEARGLLEMVRAIDLLPESTGARLQLAGVISPVELRNTVALLPGWAKTVDHGHLSRAEVNQLLGQSRVGLAVLHPHPNYVVAYATKMFEYMAAGVPVIASHFPLWEQILVETGAGVVVNPLDPRAIADAILALLLDPSAAETMGKRGQRAIKERFNWNREAAKLLDLYSDLTQNVAFPLPRQAANA